MKRSFVAARTFRDYVVQSQEATTYRLLDERAKAHSNTVFLRHENEVRLWMQGLNLYHDAMTGEWEVPAAPTEAVCALQVIRQILGLALDTAKGTLDNVLSGHFSLGLSGCRHLLESAIQVRFLHYVPEAHHRWANNPEERTPSFSEMRDALKRHEHFAEASDAFDALRANLNFYSKGAHPTGIGLRQTQTTDGHRHILGANEQQVELAGVALRGGLQALSFLLLEVQMIRPVSASSLVYKIHQFNQEAGAIIERQESPSAANTEVDQTRRPNKV